MEKIRTIENKLADLFKDLPALPKNAKKTIVEYWPYVVLVIGILQLAAAWSLWRFFDRANELVTGVNSFISAYTNTVVGFTAFDKAVIYLGIAILVVQAVLLIMAFSPLKARLRKGWDLLFLVALSQVVYAVVSAFIDGRGFGSLVFGLIGAAIGFYFLFQIREFYGAKPVATKTTVK
jgi:hypothetical protein